MIVKSSGVEWIGDIPQEWEVSRIKYVSDFQPTCDTSMLTNESIVTYTPMEYIKNGYYIENDSPYGKLSSSLTQYCEGDIVMAKVTPCFENGNIAIMTNLSSGIGMGSSELFVFRAKRINVKYLFYWLRNTGFVNAACATMTGTGGLKRVSPYFVYNSVICYPKNNEYQQRIVEFLDRKCAEIDSVISKTKATIEQYKALKQSVITQAVTKGIRPDRPMKDSGIEWIGEIPQEWSVVKMKHLGRCRNGLTYSPENVVDEESGTLVLRSSNIKDGKLIFSDNVFVNNDIREELMVKQGDILICSRNGSRSLIGKNAIIPKELVATFGAFMMVFRCATPEYVRYILSSDIFSYYLGTFLTSTINQLTADNFNNMQVVYCQDEAEQTEIISFLDRKCAEIDKLIDAKEQLLTELESYKKSVIYEYVTGKKEV